MKIIVFSSAIVALFATSGYAQDPPQQETASTTHGIGVSIGVNQVKEENLLNRVHSGFITTLSYEYIAAQQQYRDFQLLLGYSRVMAESEDITKSVNFLLALSYTYAFEVIDDQSLRYYLGPQAKITYSAAGYPNWDDSHLYWANSLSAGINNILIYSFQRETRIVSRLSIPLVTLFSRPDLLRLYKFDDLSFNGIVKNFHSNVTTGFWTTALLLRFDVEYQFPAFRTKQEAFFYSLEYMRLRAGDGNPYIQLIHQVGIKVLL